MRAWGGGIEVHAEAGAELGVAATAKISADLPDNQVCLGASAVKQRVWVHTH